MKLGFVDFLRMSFPLPNSLNCLWTCPALDVPNFLNWILPWSKINVSLLTVLPMSSECNNVDNLHSKLIIVNFYILRICGTFQENSSCRDTIFVCIVWLFFIINQRNRSKGTCLPHKPWLTSQVIFWVMLLFFLWPSTNNKHSFFPP